MGRKVGKDGVLRCKRIEYEGQWQETLLYL